MDICNLKTGICSLQMHIAKLQTEFLPKIARLSEELWTPFLERETFLRNISSEGNNEALIRYKQTSQPHLPDVLRRRNPLLLLEHPAEMLGVLKAEAVGYLGDGFSCRQPVFGKLDDEPTDVAARCVAGRLFIVKSK